LVQQASQQDECRRGSSVVTDWVRIGRGGKDRKGERVDEKGQKE
jgi:hypothetical protein